MGSLRTVLLSGGKPKLRGQSHVCKACLEKVLVVESVGQRCLHLAVVECQRRRRVGLGKRCAACVPQRAFQPDRCGKVFGKRLPVIAKQRRFKSLLPCGRFWRDISVAFGSYGLRVQQIVCRVCAGSPFFIMQQSFVARFVDIGGQGGVELRHFQLEAVTVMGGVEGVAEVEIFFFEQPVRGSRIVAPLGSHVSPVTRHQETALVAAAVIVEHEAVAIVDVVFQAGVGVEE